MSGSDRSREDSRPALTRRELIGGAAGTIGIAAAALTAHPANVEAQRAEGCFFALDIPNFFTGVFAHANGLGSETIAANGPSDAAPQHRTKWSDIELKRGVDSSMELVEWRQLAEDGRIGDAKKTGSITLYNATGSPVASWAIRNAWPKKIYVSSSEHDGAPCAWESLTLQVESAERIR
jgi:phage tail-like protein